MSGIWGAIIRQTSQSPAKLALFGVLTIGATAVLGSIFSSMTAAPQSPQELKRSLESMPFDSQVSQCGHCMHAHGGRGVQCARRPGTVCA